MKRWSYLGLSACVGLAMACQDATPPLTEAQRAVSPNLGTVDRDHLRILSYDDIKDGIIVPQGNAGAEYTIVLTNLDAKGENSAVYAMTTQRVAGVGAPLNVASGVPPASGMLLFNEGADFETQAALGRRLQRSRAQGRRIESSFHHLTRQPLLRAAQEYRASRAKMPIRRSITASLPDVGDTLTVNTPTGFCTSVTPTRAVVKAVSARAIVLSDIASPSGGFSDPEFASFAQEFDQVTYNTVTNYFGAPSDFDANGRVYIYFTPFVNSLSPTDPNAGYVGGLFYSGDLEPSSVCPASNDGEIFYVMTPDPTGTVSQPFQREQVLQGVRGTLAHEFVHMVGAGYRYSTPGVTHLESPWLDEGMAHMAEQMVGRVVVGKMIDERITAQFLSQMDDAAWEAYFLGDILNSLLYLKNVGGAGPIASRNLAESSVEVRGASWALLQFAGDHFSGGNRKNLYRSLIATGDTGIVNLTNRIGVPLDTLLTHWHVAISGTNTISPPSLQYSSYAWTDIYSAFRLQGDPAGYAIIPREIPVARDNTITTTVFGSSAGFFTVKQSKNAAQRIKIGIDTTQTPRSSIRIGVIRTK